MTVNNSKVFELESCIYLAADENNEPHYYNRNPLDIKDEDELNRCETRISDEISEYIPHSDVHHPIAIQIRIRSLRDAQPFMPDRLEAIRDGSIDCHVEDLNGDIIEILPEPVRYGEYSLGGMVLDHNTGEALELRLYNSKGECFDGQKEHSLEIIGGSAVFKTQNGGEKGDDFLGNVFEPTSA